MVNGQWSYYHVKITMHNAVGESKNTGWERPNVCNMVIISCLVFIQGIKKRENNTPNLSKFLFSIILKGLKKDNNQMICLFLKVAYISSNFKYSNMG